MGNQLRKNVLLGMFVMIGVVLFIAGIFLIGARNEVFSDTFPVVARFSNSAGLKRGSTVRYNGVNVGIVKSVTLTAEAEVTVEMRIENKMRGFIHKNSAASITSDGLMGDKLIAIVPGAGQSPVVNDFDTIAAHDAALTEKMMTTLAESNENVRAITADLKLLTGDLRNGNGLIQTLYRDTTMTVKVQHTFGRLDDITSTLTEASKALKNTTSKINNGDGLVGKLINDTAMPARLAYSLDNLKETTDRLSRASEQLSEIVQNAQSGKGSVNMLLTDTLLSANVRESVTNIKDAAQNLNDNMEALKHSFLLRGYFRKKDKQKK